MNKILIFLCVISISACSSVTNIQESFKSEDSEFNLLLNSKIKFAGTEKIYLKEFVKTFSDEYSDTSKLNNKLYDLFLKEFKTQIPGIKFSRSESQTSQILQDELSFRNYNKALPDSFFNKLDSDYLIFIKSIEINNAYENLQFYNAATSSMSGSSSEKCIVLMEVELWDVANKKRLLRFKGIGRDTVFLFSYLNSLNGAIQNAVAHSVEYIRGITL
jgi:hypothetical protein